jgi:hypothetical protein
MSSLNNDRLIELRVEVESGIRTSANKRELCALIDSALNPPGEIGEIVDGLRSISADMKHSHAHLSCAITFGPTQWAAVKRAIAYLSAARPSQDVPNGVFGRTDLPNVTVYTVPASSIDGFENDIGYWQMVMFGAHQRALDAVIAERDELLVSLGKQLLARARVDAGAHLSSQPDTASEGGYTCFEKGCPGRHASKRELCTATDVALREASKATDAQVYAMCDYYTMDKGGCKKCPRLIDTPYGEAESGCFGLAEEVLLRARTILGGCP